MAQLFAQIEDLRRDVEPQLYDHNCGPTALSYILAYDLRRDGVVLPVWTPRGLQVSLTERMAVTHSGGIDLGGMAHFLWHNDIRYTTSQGLDLEDEQATIFDLLDNNIPSMVLWNGWGPHWSVVTGYNLDRWRDWGGAICLLDPAIGEEVWYPCLQFRLLWNAGGLYGKGKWIAPVSSISKLWRTNDARWV